MSSFDECDLDSLDDQDLRRLHHGTSTLLDDDDDDERAEGIEQHVWGLEVQAEIALLSNRQSF
jgi:hypothetical protein